jgi:hypothetical protein
MNAQTVVLVGVAVLILLIGGWWLVTSQNTGSMATTTPNGATTPPTGTSSEPTTPATARVHLAVLNISGSGQGKQRGCDHVVMVPWTIATTTAPLSAALRALFSISTTSVGGHFNFIDRTNETLKFDRATVQNGTAHIYLTGQLSGLAGVCDDPRSAIQIEETALQFSTVQKVQLYLNGNPSTLVPSQQ